MGIPDNPTSASQVEQVLNQYRLGGADNESNYGTGYLACMYLGYLQNGTGPVSAQAISSGLSDVLKDLNDNKSLDDVLQGLGYTSIDDFQNRFASDAATFVCDLSNVVNSGGNTGTGGLVGGLVKNDDILPDNKENVSLFQLNTVSTSMVNTYPAGYDIRSGGSATNGKGGYTGTHGGTGTSGGGGGGNGGGGSVSFYANSRTKYSGLKLQVGADSSSPNQIRIFIDAMNSKSLGVNKVNVTTQDLARMSIERVSLALAEVSRQRAELGSYQNRIEHTVKNLGNVIENTTASESQIRDTDMATEMVRYANSNILMNAGWSVLAQATQSNVGVLNLLS
jgi:flagellin